MKKISYLSERIYEEIERPQENISLEEWSYWRKMLGESTFKYLLNNKQKFKAFLYDSEYTVEANTISDNLLKFLLQKKKDKKELIYFERKPIYEEFYYRIVQYCITALEIRLQKFRNYYSESIYKDFSEYLVMQLENICLRTLILQMHMYKQEGKLQGDTSIQEYEFFCKQCIDKSWFYEELFEEYPVLYRCVLNRCSQIEDYYVEVIKNFSEDREKIQQEMLEGKYISKITGIKGGFSDVHNAGKQVLQIQIDNDIEILYKPHSMENERIFYNLLNWFGERTGITQSTYPFISKNAYSWSAKVECKTCEKEQQLEMYYLRLGVQLFLAYLLGTKDLHCENIIASGEYPVLIDLEVLVSITKEKTRKTVSEEIYCQLSQSVLFTGLLPFYYWNRDGKGINSSAISGLGGQQYPFKVPVVIHEKTSNMRIEYQYPISKNAKNLATLRGTFYEPYLYSREIIKGFTEAYKQAIQNKEELKAQLKLLNGINNRVLAADTQRYAMMLSSSYHPSLLIDGAKREVFLYSMLTGRKEQDITIVNSEIQSMLNGDIPYFYNKLSEKHLLCNQKIIWFGCQK